MFTIHLINGDGQIVKSEQVLPDMVQAKREQYRRTIRSLWTGNSFTVRVDGPA